MLKRMTIGKKIGLGFGLVITLLVVVAVTGYSSTNTATSNIDSIVGQLEIAEEINTVLTDAQDAQAAALRYMIYDDEQYYQEIEGETANAREHAQAAKELMLSQENRANADEVIDQLDLYLAANQAWREQQLQKRNGGRLRAQSAGVVLDKIKQLIDAQQELIARRTQSSGDERMTDAAVVERTLQVQEARNAFNRVQIAAQQYQLAVTPQAQDETARVWLDEIAATRKVLTDCQAVMQDPTALKCLDQCLAALVEYSDQVQTYREINIAQRDIQLNKQKPAADALMAQSRAVRDGVYSFIDDVNTRTGKTMSFVSTLISTIGIGAVILGVFCAVVITRGIIRALERIIAGLTEGADQVNDAAAQVAAASQQLANGASEQASSLEETSSALEEMAAMTRTNADNARQANDLSEQARSAAQRGDQTTDQLNRAMNAINESSGQISKIIKVIEEIAFQTNLLALNAAVEAARAGEHGKGFAVVADEVRNLAQRAAQASGEITSLIADSVNKTKEGAEVAGEVSTALGAIVGDVTKVTDLINGIAQASQDQAQGVDQVNIAVSQMDKVTQQNASGAEESASAAEELSAQAEQVKGMVIELRGMITGNAAGVESHRKRLAKPKSRTRQHAASTSSSTNHVAGAAGDHATSFMTMEGPDEDLTEY